MDRGVLLLLPFLSALICHHSPLLVTPCPCSSPHTLVRVPSTLVCQRPPPFLQSPPLFGIVRLCLCGTHPRLHTPAFDCVCTRLSSLSVCVPCLCPLSFVSTRTPHVSIHTALVRTRLYSRPFVRACIRACSYACVH